ncbi:MAG: glycerol-3-phosphate acyltransferase [Faecousia sp.]
MKALLYISGAVCAYLVAGWNPAITFSKRIYKKDIRTCGSGNPGFTNFRRTFGNKWAWWVLALDLCKAALVVALFANLFARYLGCYQLGAAYTGLFALLGHAFPVWYRFKGGKGFLVCLSTMWVVDWRVGLFATVLMVVLLLTVKYMSVATVTALLTCPVMLLLLKAPVSVVLLCAVSAGFVAVRHAENFKRLRSGTEPRFTVKSHSEDPQKHH